MNGTREWRCAVLRTSCCATWTMFGLKSNALDEIQLVRTNAEHAVWNMPVLEYALNLANDNVMEPSCDKLVWVFRKNQKVNVLKGLSRLNQFSASPNAASPHSSAGSHVASWNSNRYFYDAHYSACLSVTAATCWIILNHRSSGFNTALVSRVFKIEARPRSCLWSCEDSFYETISLKYSPHTWNSAT